MYANRIVQHSYKTGGRYFLARPVGLQSFQTLESQVTWYNTCDKDNQIEAITDWELIVLGMTNLVKWLTTW